MIEKKEKDGPTKKRGLTPLNERFISKWEVRIWRKDNVIQQMNSQKFPRLEKQFGDFPVFHTGLNVAGGMIMADDNPGGPICYDISEYFSRMDNSPSYLIYFFSDSR